MQLVSELRAYIASQPDPVTERIKKVLGAYNGTPNPGVWAFQDAFDADLYNKSKNELNQKFGGRVQYIVGEYKKLGMLPERRPSDNRADTPNYASPVFSSLGEAIRISSAATKVRLESTAIDHPSLVVPSSLT